MSTPIPLNTSDRVLPIKVFVIFVTNAYNILELKKKNRSITRDIQPLTNFSLVRPPAAAAADPLLYVCPFFHHHEPPITNRYTIYWADGNAAASFISNTSSFDGGNFLFLSFNIFN